MGSHIHWQHAGDAVKLQHLSGQPGNWNIYCRFTMFSLTVWMMLWNKFLMNASWQAKTKIHLCSEEDFLHFRPQVGSYVSQRTKYRRDFRGPTQLNSANFQHFIYLFIFRIRFSLAANSRQQNLMIKMWASNKINQIFADLE